MRQGLYMVTELLKPASNTQNSCFQPSFAVVSFQNKDYKNQAACGHILCLIADISGRASYLMELKHF